MRRINLLKEEATRIADNVTLSHSEKIKINSAKYSAMMAPIVVALERRLASTSRKPETPHEIWFHDEYREQIKSAILNLRLLWHQLLHLGMCGGHLTLLHWHLIRGSHHYLLEKLHLI